MSYFNLIQAQSYLFTIQNVSIKFQSYQSMILKYEKFTIQNVSIKY